MSAKQDALVEVVEIIRRHELTLDEITAALGDNPAFKRVRYGGVLSRLFGYIGGIFVFAGLAIYVGMRWDHLGALGHILLTLGVGFSVFLLAALLPWIFFSTAVLQGLNSILGNQELIRKVRVPQAVFPLSVVGSNLVNFALSLLPLREGAAPRDLLPPGAFYGILSPVVAPDGKTVAVGLTDTPPSATSAAT